MSDEKGSKGAVIGTVIGTVAAIGAGFAFGFAGMKGAAPAANQPAASSAKTAEQKPSDVRPIAPIVTNLRDPSNLFIRLEAALVLEPNTPDAAALVAKIGDDLVSYLRTVSLSELEGPTAFQYFREDLKKRSVQLGGGKVKELLLQSLVIQ
jgi:flagellar FliL protein